MNKNCNGLNKKCIHYIPHKEPIYEGLCVYIHFLLLPNNPCGYGLTKEEINKKINDNFRRLK